MFGQTDLQIFNGTDIEDSYYQQVILSSCASVSRFYRVDFVLMDVNTWPHRTLAVEMLLESACINKREWSASLQH